MGPDRILTLAYIFFFINKDYVATHLFKYGASFIFFSPVLEYEMRFSEYISSLRPREKGRDSNIFSFDILYGLPKLFLRSGRPMISFNVTSRTIGKLGTVGRFLFLKIDPLDRRTSSHPAVPNRDGRAASRPPPGPRRLLFTPRDRTS